MTTPESDIDPKVLALPDEGKREYIWYSEVYKKITALCMDNVEAIKKIKKQDPIHANLCDMAIASLLEEASRNVDEWNVRRQRILEKWMGKP